MDQQCSDLAFVHFLNKLDHCSIISLTGIQCSTPIDGSTISPKELVDGIDNQLNIGIIASAHNK